MRDGAEPLTNAQLILDRRTRGGFTQHGNPIRLFGQTYRVGQVLVGNALPGGIVLAWAKGFPLWRALRIGDWLELTTNAWMS